MINTRFLEVLSWENLEFRFCTPGTESESSEESSDEPDNKENQAKTQTGSTSQKMDTENQSTRPPIMIDLSSEDSSSENQPRWHDRLDGPESGTDSGSDDQIPPPDSKLDDECIILSD